MLPSMQGFLERNDIETERLRHGCVGYVSNMIVEATKKVRVFQKRGHSKRVPP